MLENLNFYIQSLNAVVFDETISQVEAIGMIKAKCNEIIEFVNTFDTGKLNTPETATNGNFAKFNTLKQVIDSGINDNDLLHKDGNEFIEGIKLFTEKLRSTNGSPDHITDVITKGYFDVENEKNCLKPDNAIEGNFVSFDDEKQPIDSGKKNADFVHIEGTENITGEKTFTNGKSSTPTQPTHIANKQYVDNSIEDLIEKPETATEGNIAVFDENKNPIDGGVAIDDVKSKIIENYVVDTPNITTSLTNLVNGIFTTNNHGFHPVGDEDFFPTRIQFIKDNGGNLPTGIDENTIYYVFAIPSNNTFQISKYGTSILSGFASAGNNYHIREAGEYNINISLDNIKYGKKYDVLINFVNNDTLYYVLDNKDNELIFGEMNGYTLIRVELFPNENFYDMIVTALVNNYIGDSKYNYSHFETPLESLVIFGGSYVPNGSQIIVYEIN